MSSSTERSDRDIVPPIIFNEDADVQIYPSVDAATRDVEAVDIVSSRFTFHDSTGRLLKASVHHGRVTLEPTSVIEPDSETLRSNMLQFLRWRGVPETDLSGASFGELVRLLGGESGR